MVIRTEHHVAKPVCLCGTSVSKGENECLLARQHSRKMQAPVSGKMLLSTLSTCISHHLFHFFSISSLRFFLVPFFFILPNSLDTVVLDVCKDKVFADQ